MDSIVKEEKMNIRKIEDIIEIQKANGNINVRQVAFNLPMKTDSKMAATLAKSLETGLAKVKCDRSKMKNKKVRLKRRKCSLPDMMSWPSDSDITVLRMKLPLNNEIKKKKVGTIVPGDGLHKQDSSSMVNLATLIYKSQPPSVYSMNLEEYLLPLTSWENIVECEPKEFKVDKENNSLDLKTECRVCDATCSSHGTDFHNTDSCESNNVVNARSRVARFLRLYFCPCCTCLYKMEKLREDQSVYCTKELYDIEK